MPLSIPTKNIGDSLTASEFNELLAKVNEYDDRAWTSSDIGDLDTEIGNHPDVVANTAKTGITAGQASAITANTAKISYTDATAVGLNTAKISATGTEVEPTDINTLAKVNAIITDATLIDTADSRLSDARTPTTHTHTASEVTDFDTEVSNNASVVANTAKVSYTDASAVSANTAKVSADGSIATHSDVDLTGIADEYILKWNTTNSRFEPAVDAGAGGGINNLVEDLTPQLGGALDLNGNVITGMVIGTNLQAWSAVLDATTASFLIADEAKLDAIEASATADQTASEVPIVDVGVIITATDVEGALQENRTAIDLNTLKVTYPSADSSKLAGIEVGATADQTSIVGITGSKAQFNTAVTDGSFMYTGEAPTAHTHTASEVTDFDTEVSNNTSVALNTAKVSYTDATKVGLISVTQAVNLDTMESDIVTNNAKVSYTDGTKVAFISVTQAVNLDTMETNIATNNAKVTNKEPQTDTPTTVITLDNPEGRYSNMVTANTNSTFTTTGTTLGAKCKMKINNATRPTITGATLLDSPAHQVSTNMYMYVEYNGNNVDYFFTKITA